MEVENGYTVKVSTTNSDDWEYNGKTSVFLTTNALIDFIETLL